MESFVCVQYSVMVCVWIHSFMVCVCVLCVECDGEAGQRGGEEHSTELRATGGENGKRQVRE